MWTHAAASSRSTSSIVGSRADSGFVEGVRALTKQRIAQAVEHLPFTSPVSVSRAVRTRRSCSVGPTSIRAPASSARRRRLGYAESSFRRRRSLRISRRVADLPQQS